MATRPKFSDPSLAEHDPELYEIIQQEKRRQFRGLELIASENFTSKAVMECLGSCLTNKYSEGEVGARYYGGNEYIDMVESLAKKRALQAFSLNPDEWGVNVQPYSGSPANFAVYVAVLHPHDRIMGLDLPSGGHLTHGFYTPTRKVSATSMFFESLPYHVNKDGFIDFPELEQLSTLFRPKVIIAGHSAYPRDIDFAKFSQIAKNCGAMLMADSAHVSGLVSSGEHSSPFPYCDFVTMTTHKILRGPRSGVVFFRKLTADGKPTGYETKLNQAVFPGLQGGPHENTIAALATQLKQVMTPEYKAYAKQVKVNATAMANAMMAKGYKLVSGGTENHLFLVDYRPQGLTGSKMEKILESVSISVNKNSLVGDKAAGNPSGIRIGTAALTTRGYVEADFVKVAEFIVEASEIAAEIQKGEKVLLVDFVKAVKENPRVKALKAKVEAFAIQFPMPGLDVNEAELRKE